MKYTNDEIVAKIIYLSEIKFSIKIAKTCIEQAKKFGVEVTPFKGIHGYNASQYLKKLFIKPKYFFKRGRRGVIGCFLSHYLLWNECLKFNKPYLILEHDGFFINNLPDTILETFDDILKLDNEDPYSENYEERISDNRKIEVSKYFNPNSKNLELNGTGNYMQGAYGYIIKPAAAKKLILWVKKNGFLPSDIQMGDKIVDIKVIKPTIVRLHPLFNNRADQISLTRTII